MKIETRPESLRLPGIEEPFKDPKTAINSPEVRDLIEE